MAPRISRPRAAKRKDMTPQGVPETVTLSDPESQDESPKKQASASAQQETHSAKDSQDYFSDEEVQQATAVTPPEGSSLEKSPDLATGLDQVTKPQEEEDSREETTEQSSPKETPAEKGEDPPLTQEKQAPVLDLKSQKVCAAIPSNEQEPTTPFLDQEADAPVQAPSSAVTGMLSTAERLKRKKTAGRNLSSKKPRGNPLFYTPILEPSGLSEDLDRLLKDSEFPTRRLGERKIAPCRYINFDFFRTTNLQSIPNQFSNLTIGEFCAYNTPASAELTKKFYRHITFHRVDDVLRFIKVRIDGSVYIFSLADVCQAFNAACHSETKLLDISKSAAYRRLTGSDQSSKTGYMESTQLPLETRLLHRAVMYCLFPRAGSTDSIITKDAVMMIHLLEGLAINLGSIIFDHMERCINLAERALPYAHIIPKLLQIHDFKVPALEDKDIILVEPFDGSTLDRMGFVFSGTNWMRRKLKGEPSSSSAKPSKAAKGKGVAAESSKHKTRTETKSRKKKASPQASPSAGLKLDTKDSQKLDKVLSKQQKMESLITKLLVDLADLTAYVKGKDNVSSSSTPEEEESD